MSRKRKEKTVKNAVGELDSEQLINLAGGLLNNTNSANLDSIMKLTSSMLNNEKLLNSVAGLSLEKQNEDVSDSQSAVLKKLGKELNIGHLLFNRWKSMVGGVMQLNSNKAELAAIAKQLEKIQNTLEEIKEQRDDSHSG
ncbi:hypothetical protein WQ57_13420 [Mesobacillus campisalis]|uniref:Uncharacterized protein n=1 Tax=Mesobacillus campisalis TaxID=1408103 RepID=A0A0M2SS97_9BACI|nr:hypothetical protein [Mesobacillus campisalis]KKK37449.1 hypothetical protein WQ57_13420 [Mesobacillus campisalis]